MHIVICDDEAGRRAEWEERLRAILEPADRAAFELASDSSFRRDYGVLNDRRGLARSSRDGSAGLTARDVEHDPWDEETVFDRADVLLIDYDLFGFDEHEYLTGEIVAYMARCYSKCKVIVGINGSGRNPFDLTLASTARSFADVTIGEAQIDNPGLWLQSPTSGFRPWAWPVLWDLVDRHQRRCRITSSRAADAVLNVVGLGDYQQLLPRSAIGLLEHGGEQGVLTKVEEIATGPRLGLRRGDVPASAESTARIAAARIAKWVDCVVVPLQDVLIDAPHLAQRNPALLATSDSTAVTGDDWDATARLPAGTSECGLRPETVPYGHTAGEWTSRPTFYWPSLSADPGLPGVSEPYNVPMSDLVFCEDLSRFEPRESSRRFVAMLDSSSPIRWVGEPQRHPELADVEYQPLARLAM